MVTTQDASIGMATESTFGTAVTPTRWLEFVDESLQWNKNVVQGAGLRVGGRVARSARRVVTTVSGGGDMTIEWASKGLGMLLAACMGNGTSSLISGSNYQQLFTLGDTPPSLTMQKTLPQAGGTLTSHTYSGCMVDSFEIDFANADIVQINPTFVMGNFSTVPAYTTPSYAAAPVSLYQFANGSITTGTTLVAPTATTVASFTGGTSVLDVRGGSVVVDNNLTSDRFNLGGQGKMLKPTVGLRGITGTITVEYDNETYNSLYLADTPMAAIFNFTGAAGEVLQIVLPEFKFDSQLPVANSTDLITTDMGFSVLDNLTAAQPIWIVQQTLDTAL